MSRSFFTSDTHAWHAEILKHTNRPYQDREEMTHAIIQTWNQVVSPGDIVYHLGDFAFRCTAEEAAWFRWQLNGQIALVRGNHDEAAEEIQAKPHYWKGRQKPFVWIKERHLLKIKDPEAPLGRRLIVLDHYAGRAWHLQHRGAWQLFGHSHGNLKTLPNRQEINTLYEWVAQLAEDGVAAADQFRTLLDRIPCGDEISNLDVGWDVWHHPITYREVKEVLGERKFVPIDHHLPEKEYDI